MALKAMKRPSMVRKAMKRPASAARTVKKLKTVCKCTVERTKTATKNTAKKLMTTTKFSAAKTRAIIAALKDVKGVPACVKKMLVRLSGKKLDTHGHEAAISMLGSILSTKDDTLQQAVCALQAEVDGAEKGKASLAQAQSAAESRAEELKETIVEKKAALSIACKTIEAAQDAVAKGKAGRKHEGAELESVTRKKERLESTKEITFTPLKETKAKGINGQKQLKELRKVGKEFGFHDVLIDSIPAVLRKQPDRRQTFDALAMRSFSTEFSKNVDKLEAAAKDKEMAVAEHVEAENAAQEDLRAAKETRTESTKEHSEAESALVEAQSELATIKRRLRDSPKDANATSRRLGQAKVQLSAFRAGPFAAMGELQRLTQALPLATAIPKAAESKSEMNETESDELPVGQEAATQEEEFMATPQTLRAASAM